MDPNTFLKDTLETVGEIDYLLILINLFFCLVSSFILMYVYRYKSNSLSSKTQISPIIPLLSNITFLVILIVKSSLALSLGLVGALSVIRFRTPVKEPEDLAFLFFAIALGIGYGAFQLYATSIIFIILIIIIWIFLSNKKQDVINDFNIVIETSNDKTHKNFDKILTLLKSNCSEVNLVKVEKETNSTITYYRVTFDNLSNIKKLMYNLNNKFADIKFSLYENRIID